MFRYKQRQHADRDVYRCVNKDHIRYLGRYLYKVKYKWSNKTKLIET